MKKKAIEDLKQEIRYLRSELDMTIRERNKQEALAGRHRRYLRDKFNWFVDISADTKTPNLPALIKDMTQHFSNTGDFAKS